MEGLNGAAPEESGPPPPSKTTVLRPVGAQVMELPSGETLVNFEMPWPEVIGIMLPSDSKKTLVSALTSGIIIGGEMPPLL